MAVWRGVLEDRPCQQTSFPGDLHIHDWEHECPVTCEACSLRRFPNVFRMWIKKSPSSNGGVTSIAAGPCAKKMSWGQGCEASLEGCVYGIRF